MKRPRIAAVVTEVRRYSHAQHILDRFLFGYSWDGRHHVPDIELVALYTDQRPDGELSRDRAKMFPQMKIYPTISEALCRGGRRLDVDSRPRNRPGRVHGRTVPETRPLISKSTPRALKSHSRPLGRRAWRQPPGRR